ncbi:MAG: protein BatD [Rikenellaceae bacterium]|nr:protein BatD [Rikenellaceae bacterium]
MQTFMKKIPVLFAALLSVFSVVAAEEVSFSVNAPMIATVGEGFRVEFELNAKPDSDSFVPPTFENFDVVAGPSVSQGSSIQIVNGAMNKSISYAITYVLVPQKAGTFAISPATIEVKGKSYSTQRTMIEVRSAEQTNGATNQGGRQEQNESAESRANRSIEKDDLLYRLVLSSKSVYRGEPIRAILKLYSRANIAGSEGAKMPAFNGFWSQQVDIEQGPFRETLNGKVYEAYNIAEYLLYPQQSGTLTIEPAELTVIAQVMVRSNRSFDPFFGGGHEVYNVRRALKTPEVKVQVKEFPAGAPASFTGAVGRYTMSHKLSSSEVAANSAVTLQLTISGTGNLNFLSAPTLSLPSSFELYDVKSEEKIQNKPSGSVGYRRFDYPFIVRAEGEYDIAPVEFTYFDIEKRQYVTLSTPPMKLMVTPDKSSTAQQQAVSVGIKREDVRLLGEDIRFIKLGYPALRSVVAPFALSPLYWAIMVAMLLIAVVAYFVVRKYIRDSRNVVLVKGKRANKVAIKRFRIAEKYMREQDRRAFYEEMLRALWGYLGDRFNIPVADLTREVVREELSRRGAANEAECVIAVIARCEEAQYSPAASAEMKDVYEEGVDAVSKIESAIKK